MNGEKKFVVYEASLSCLRDLTEASILRMAVENCVASMTFDSVVSAIVESLGCRTRVLELSNELELTNDPSLRAAMRADEERIAGLLVSIFSSKSDEETVLRLEGDSAQHFLDVVQETLDRGFLMTQKHNRMALRIIRKLSESCDMLPTSLFIVGVNGRDEHPSFGGGFGDIYRALYGDQCVALKRMRHFLRGSDLRRIRLKFCREALLWKELHHPHILPFLGIDRDSFPSSFCMVSPWMEHGTVMHYLKTHGHANVNKLLYEIAQGLEYLHSHNIVHGDLRGANILIKEDWSACLADFGLSILSDVTSMTSSNRGGNPHWMAPELLDPARFGSKFIRAPANDVYAFGCVCFELYTGRPPFAGMSDPAALLMVLDGARPERPLGPPAMSDILWKHITEFWAESPTARPSTQLVVRSMAGLLLGPQFLAAPLLLGTPSEPSPQLILAGNASRSIPLATDESLKPPLADADTSFMPVLDLVNSGIESSGPDTQLEDAEVPTNATAGGEDVKYRALALYAYTAADPADISFSVGEYLDIVDQENGWCPVRNADGSTGTAPRNFLKIIPAENLYTKLVEVPPVTANSRPFITLGEDDPMVTSDSPAARMLPSRGPLPAHVPGQEIQYEAQTVSSSIMSPTDGTSRGNPKSVIPPPRKSKWWQTKSLDAVINTLSSKTATGRVRRAANSAPKDRYYSEFIDDYSLALHSNEISLRQGDIVAASAGAKHQTEEPDEAISMPWNFQHNVHVDDGLIGLPLLWTTSRQEAGFSDHEIAVIRRNNGQEIKSPVEDRASFESVSLTDTILTNTTASAGDEDACRVHVWKMALPSPDNAAPYSNEIQLPHGDIIATSAGGEDAKYQAGAVAEESNEGISMPWNFQHIVHVDEGLACLPPSWAASLQEAGFSDDEIAVIRESTPFPSYLL